MATHTFRMEFRDEPGMLADLTAAIAGCGADIVAVDVQELDGETVIDELVVETGPSTPGALRDALLAAGALAVISTSTAPRLTDAIVQCLDGAGELVAALGRGEDTDAPCGQLLRLCRAEEVTVLAATDAATVALAARALAKGAPTAEREGDRWALALPHPEEAPQHVYLVRRSGPMRFSATEVARLRAVLRLHRRLCAAAMPG